MTNICIHISCSSLENHTQFQTKNMDKFYTVFRLKQGGIYLYCFYKRVLLGLAPLFIQHTVELSSRIKMFQVLALLEACGCFSKFSSAESTTCMSCL